MFHDMLVYVDASDASSRRVALAARIAERAEARLTGLHVKWLQEALYWADPATIGLVAAAARDSVDAQAAEAATRFRAETAGTGIETEWRVVSGPLVRSVAAEGRLADLVILGQHDPDGAAGIETDGLAEQIILNSGRPCLIVPYAGSFPALGQRILIAWNGSREAARAVHDAMPLLRRATRVDVIRFDLRAAASGKAAPIDIAPHLARHGVPVETRIGVCDESAIGDLLLALAADLSADLIVSGAYGHARGRDLVLGNVTRALMSDMSVPILMSH